MILGQRKQNTGGSGNKSAQHWHKRHKKSKHAQQNRMWHLQDCHSHSHEQADQKEKCELASNVASYDMHQSVQHKDCALLKWKVAAQPAHDARSIYQEVEDQHGDHDKIQNEIEDTSEKWDDIIGKICQVANNYLTGLLNLCLVDTKGLEGHFQRRCLATCVWLKEMRNFASQFADLLDGSSANKIDHDTKADEHDEIDDQYCQHTRHHACGELDSRGKSNGQEPRDGQ